MVDELMLRANIEEIIGALSEHGAPAVANSMRTALDNDSRSSPGEGDRYLNYRRSLLIFRAALDAVQWMDQIHTLLDVEKVRFITEITERSVYSSVSERLMDDVVRADKLRAICDDLLQSIEIK